MSRCDLCNLDFEARFAKQHANSKFHLRMRRMLVREGHETYEERLNAIAKKIAYLVTGRNGKEEDTHSLALRFLRDYKKKGRIVYP